jgi:hypothetical protein
MLANTSLGGDGDEEESPEFDTFKGQRLLEETLRRVAGRAIMVAHDLREQRTGSRTEAVDVMTGKLGPLWTAAKEAAGNSGGCRKPFLIAMISTFFDHFTTIEYPRPAAGPWNIMRVRPAISPAPGKQVDPDPETWEPLVENLGRWLQAIRGQGLPSGTRCRASP